MPQDRRRRHPPRESQIFDVFRFLFVLAAIAGIVYGSMVALVMLVDPRERDVTVRIPSERLNPATPQQ